MADNIAHANVIFYPLYLKPNKSKNHMQTCKFHLLLGFVENQIVFWNFKIHNGIQITKVLDNGNLDNQGPIIIDRVLVWFLGLVDLQWHTERGIKPYEQCQIYQLAMRFIKYCIELSLAWPVVKSLLHASQELMWIRKL